jgi:thiamine biosynthesis lipoprotein ApbE
MNARIVNAGEILCAACTFMLAVGCEQKRQTTYNEAVQVYAAEMNELERLEVQRAKLLQATKAPGGELGDLKDVLNSVVGDSAALREATKGLVDPSLQDKADKKVEEGLKKINDQLDKENKNADQRKQEAEKAKLEAEKELPALEIQIEKQKARVETARKAKEALAP